MLLDCVIGAIAGHHLKLDESWKKAVLALQGGCGTTLRLLLTHSDLESLVPRGICTTEITFSLIDGDPTYIGLQHVPFSLGSHRWSESLSKSSEWWRF